MEHAELFLLLPRYKEVSGQPEYILPMDVMSEEEMGKMIERLDEVCCYIENENYQGYYDAENVEAFLYPVKMVEDCYPNAITRMRMVMNKWGENWRKQKKQNDAKSYMYFCLAIKGDTLCEVTERKATSTDNSVFLLVNHGAFSSASEVVRTKCDRKEVELDVRKADAKSISEWFAVNRRPQRIFNLNPKHGENGKGAHAEHKGCKVSVLKCSKEEAKRMLDKAVGFDDRKLYYFDKKQNQYIEFKCEGKNAYHAFHVDAEDEKRVPDAIKAMIGRLS